MAHLKGTILFTGSIGNIRSYYSKQLKRYILATKGGASKEVIKNNPVFARTRENMNEFKACGLWASQLKKSLFAISNLHQGYYFSEIVALAKSIQKHDENHPRGFRSIVSSLDAKLLTFINFNRIYPFDRVLTQGFEVLFSDDKRTVTLKMLGFKSFSRLNWPVSYQSYRVALVIAQLPDFVWTEQEKNYQPVYKDMDLLSVSAFSEWLPCSTDPVDIILSASFAHPALQQPGTTVIVAMGIEVLSAPTIGSTLNPSGIGTMKIVECYV
jgi:hypothetical protein